MKKVISAHLDGKMFQIEEDAYSYLNSVLSGQWKKQELETQIATRLEQKLIVGKTFINYPDVVDVLYNLGISAAEYHSATSNMREKRLYRQQKDKMIGGVCSGLGEYFEIDPVILRALFVIGFFMFLGFWAYIILWIIVPKSSQKLTV